MEARLAILSWLWADLDISAAKAIIQNLPEGQNYVPLAPTLTATGGINVIRDQGFKRLDPLQTSQRQACK